MRKKKIVVYFGKVKSPPDPFKGFGKKRKVYWDLFSFAAENDLEIFIASGENSFRGDMRFANILKFENNFFTKFEQEIVADAVYDRSGGLKFPLLEMNGKVLNCRSFKILCADKNATAELLGNYMPKSFKVCSRGDLLNALKNFDSEKLAVLKPSGSFGGKGILIDVPEKIAKLEINVPHTLQEFVETSKGIDGITEGRHDLRLIVIDGVFVLAHVRTPKRGSLLANVALGGSIKEVAIEKLPKNILTIANEIKKIIDDKYGSPLYSIDFGVMEGRPYVFELNDQIGFPSEQMPSAKRFIARLVSSLKKIAN